MRRCASVVVIALIGSLLLDPSADGSELPVRTFECGDEVERSVRLGGDVGSPAAPCTTTGLRVTGRGVTLDLNGHTIWGNGQDDADLSVEAGVRLTRAVTVKNGTVRGFEHGIFGLFTTETRTAKVVAAANDIGVAVSGSDHVIDNVVAVDNEGTGIRAIGNGAAIGRSTAARNGSDGISVVGNKARIRRNVSVKNATDGIEIGGADTGVLAHNVAAANTGMGINVAGAGHVVVEGNSVVGNGSHGVFVNGGGELSENRIVDNDGEGVIVHADGVRLVRNDVSANTQDGVESQGNRTVLKANRAHANGGSGLETHGTDVVAESNAVTGNRSSGVHVAAGGGSFERNVAIGNGFGAVNFEGPGIDADSATAPVDGNGNIARANDAHRCEPSSVCEDEHTDLPIETPQCGAIITRSIRLGGNVGTFVDPCNGHGLTIRGDDVVVDLNGFAVWGGSNDFTVGIIATDGARVFGGRVVGFAQGLAALAESSVWDVVVHGANGVGIGSVSGGRVDSAAAVLNGLGIGASGAKLTRSVAAQNDQYGIELGSVTAEGGRFASDNVSMENGWSGLLAERPDSRIDRNVLVANGNHGIRSTADRATIIGNLAVRNGAGAALRGISAEASSAAIRKNVTSRNGTLGIGVTGDQPAVDRNVAVSDGNNGIAFGTPAVGFEAIKNVVVDAGFHGILANAPGVLEANGVYASEEEGVFIGVGGVAGTENRAVANPTGILVGDVQDVKLRRNRAQGNGFAVVNLAGLGIDASDAPDTTGDNVAYGNDDPAGCDPARLC